MCEGSVEKASLNRAAELVALCVGYALATCCIGARLLWISVLGKLGTLSTAQLGWLASAEAVGIAMGVLVMSWLAGRVNARTSAVAAAVTVVVSNVVAMSLTPTPFVAARIVSGIGTGSLVSVVTRIAARRSDGQRALSLMQATAVFQLSGLYFFAPGLLARFGAAGLFGALAALAGLAFVTALVGVGTEFASIIVPSQPASAPRLGGFLGCVAIIFVFAGQTTVGTYLLQLGHAVGLNEGGVSAILALALPLSMVGPLGARALGDRKGLLIPLLVGLGLLAADLLLIPLAASHAFFSIATGALLLLTEFCAPYAIALIGKIDRSGRFASATPACIVIGVALGPGIGGQLVATAHFQELSLLAASIVTGGLGLFVVATRVGHPEAQGKIFAPPLGGRDAS